MSVLARLFGWLPEPGSEFGSALAAMRPSADALATCRAELRVSERCRATLQGQLDHYIGQAIRARSERDLAERGSAFAHACLASAMDRTVDLTTRILVLEGEAESFVRERETLTGIAEGLRDELREVRAGLAVGALRKGKR